MTGEPAELAPVELLPEIITLVREAGTAILRIYDQVNPTVGRKRDSSPLTLADLASHNIILRRLARLTPEWPVLSEESCETPYDQRRVWPRFWLIDPLDGTKEFLQRYDEFTINIALMIENRPTLGVIYAPAIDGLYYAAEGSGAWKSAWRTTPSRIRVASEGGDVLRIVVSRMHGHGEETLNRFTRGVEHCEVSSMGSSLKFCRIAEGTADLYPRTGPTMEWDVAAAQCIVEEAGGTVTDLEGRPLRYNKPSLVNPSFVARGGCP